MRQVKCVRPLGHLTKDRIYTVVGEPAKDAKWLTVVDDRGECATYDAARFEALLAPQVAPNFRQMQQIADEVKITCPVVEEAEARKAQPKTIMQEYTVHPQLDTSTVPLPAATDVPYDANGHITLSAEDFDKLVEDLESDLPPSPVPLSARIRFLSLKLQDAKKEVDRLNQVLQYKDMEINTLRQYGNKDCTAMADEELERIKQEWKKAYSGPL